MVVIDVRTSLKGSSRPLNVALSCLLVVTVTLSNFSKLKSMKSRYVGCDDEAHTVHVLLVDTGYG